MTFFSSKVPNTELHYNHILIQAMEGSGTDQEKAKSTYLFLLSNNDNDDSIDGDTMHLQHHIWRGLPMAWVAKILI